MPCLGADYDSPLLSLCLPSLYLLPSMAPFMHVHLSCVRLICFMGSRHAFIGGSFPFSPRNHQDFLADPREKTSQATKQQQEGGGDSSRSLGDFYLPPSAEREHIKTCPISRRRRRRRPRRRREREGKVIRRAQ